MGELGGLVEEQVLHDHQLHRPERGVDMRGVRIGLRDVLALDEEALERRRRSRQSNMFGIRSPGSALRSRAPQRLEHRPGRVVGHVPVAGELVRERAHVARTLDVVLTRAAG